MSLADQIEAVEEAYTGWIVTRPVGDEKEKVWLDRLHKALGDLLGDTGEEDAPVEIHIAVEAYDKMERK